jgi:hypothetical protein
MRKFALGLALTATAFSTTAQDNPAVTQTDAVRQQREARTLLDDLGPGDAVPALYKEEDEDLGPQAVLRKRKHRWFRASVDSQMFYTDNMFFRKDSDIDAGVLVNTGEAALMTPPAITRFASYRAEVGYRHQFFNYFGEDEPVSFGPGIIGPPLYREDFNFQSSTAFASLLAQTKHYQFRAGFDYTRLISSEEMEPVRGEDEEFYREYVPRWSVQRNFRLCNWSQFSVAYLGAYHFADEDPVFFFNPGSGVERGLEDRGSRWEHAAVAALSVALPHNLVAQPYYRFQYVDFDSLTRSSVTEFLHTAGFGLGWYPCENFSARVFANYNWNTSDVLAREYEQLNVGGGLNLTLRF